MSAEHIADNETARITSLGVRKIPSSLHFCRYVEDTLFPFFLDDEFLPEAADPQQMGIELAGPRRELYFDPSKTKCAIVTCGGLCPGINDVIRAITMEACHAYNVPAVLGVRYGLEGFIPKYGHELMELTPDKVSNIHQFGGTILGSSRGPQPPEDVVDEQNTRREEALARKAG